MKKTTQQLRLSKITLRNLSRSSAQDVQGGIAPTLALNCTTANSMIYYCPTKRYTCPESCAYNCTTTLPEV